MSVHIRTTKTENRRVHVNLNHPRKGLTLDDLRQLLEGAQQLELPGDTKVRADITYGEGSYRGSLSCEVTVELSDEAGGA